MSNCLAPVPKPIQRKKYQLIYDDLRKDFINRVNSNKVTIKDVWYIFFPYTYIKIYRQLMNSVWSFQPPNQFYECSVKKDALERKKPELKKGISIGKIPKSTSSRSTTTLQLLIKWTFKKKHLQAVSGGGLFSIMPEQKEFTTARNFKITENCLKTFRIMNRLFLDQCNILQIFVFHNSNSNFRRI